MPYKVRRALRQAIIKLMLLSLLSSTLAGLIPPPLVRSVAPLLADRLPQPAVALAAGTISGIVFRDYDSDGVKDSSTVSDPRTDTGVAGVTVTLYDTAGTPQGSDVTDATGAYSISAGGTGPYRVEFTTLPTGYYPTYHNSNSGSNTTAPNSTATTAGTTVQFVPDGNSSNVNLGINVPTDYSQVNPKVVLPAFKPGNTGPAMQTFSYDAPKTGNGMGIPQVYSATTGVENPVSLATPAQIGVTWGTAYQRTQKRIFTTSLLRRHAALADGPGYVYMLDPTSGYLGKFNLAGVTPATGGPALNFGSVTRTTSGLSTDDNNVSGELNRDLDAFAKVGKMGFGDADIDETGNTLWTVNLFERTLLAIDVSGGTATLNNAAPATLQPLVREYDIAGLANAPSCAGTGVLRPWGLGFEQGKGYLGLVCDASISNNVANLDAYVVVFDPSNPAAGFAPTPAVSFGLDYNRELASAFSTNGQFGAWKAWTDSWTVINATTSAAPVGGTSPVNHHMPLVSDIDFTDNGSMVIGLLDRNGFMLGFGNYMPVAGSTSLTAHNAAGDIIQACHLNGAFVLEGTGGCTVPDDGGGTTIQSTGANYVPPQAASVTNDGPSNNGEFYYQDAWASSSGHNEISLGSLAVLPGRNEVVYTVYDPLGFNPFVNTNPFGLNTNGIHYDNTTTGVNQDGYLLFTGLNNGENVNNYVDKRFGKSGGLGDLEVLVDPAPIEIGNRVWLDSDGDGRQDPNEAPISGVIVELYKNGVKVGQATTDATGEYYFTSGTNATDANTSDNIIHDSGLGIIPGTGTAGGNSLYEIRIPNVSGGSKQAALGTNVLTTANAGSNDSIDSDGSASGVNASYTIPYADLAGAGTNNHTYDFGFGPAPTTDYGDLPDTSVGTAAGDYQTLAADNGPSHGIAAILRIGAQIDGETNGQPTTLANGDDTTGTPNDEDGVQFKTPLRPGAKAIVAIGTHQPLNTNVHLNAWIDFNQDGDFADAGEQIATDELVQGDSLHTDTPFTAIPFDIPASAPAGFTYARFRVCTAAGVCNTPTGAATDGEVEDYRVQIATVAKLGDKVWLDTSGDGVQQGGEPGVPGVLVQLYRASDNALVDVVPTDANGLYLFSSLLPDTYYIKFTAPSGYTFTAPNQGSDPAANSDANQTTGLTSNITLTGGANDQSWDAGLITTVSQQTVCDALPWGVTEIDHIFNLPKFNPALGTLTGVTISAYAGLQQWIGYENIAITGVTGRVTSNSDGTLTLPNSTTLNVSVGLNTGLHSLAAYDGIVDFTGASAYALSDWMYVFNASSTNYTPVNDFIAASPGQNIALPYATLSGVAVIGGGGNIYSAQRTYALGGVCVNYSYTPPSSGTVKIIKNATGGDGSFGFTSSSATLDAVHLTTVGGMASSEVMTLNVGSYTLSEDLLVGWNLTGLSCTGDTDNGNVINLANRQVTIDLDGGESQVCTFSNTAQSSSITPSGVLTLTKSVVGSTTTGPYAVTVRGPNSYVTNTTVTAGAPRVLTGLAGGVYTVTETSPGAGWVTTYTVSAVNSNVSGVVNLSNASSIAAFAAVPVSGQVFRDFNSDGLISTGTVADTGVSGVKVTAYGVSGAACGSATSDAIGNYSFTPSCAGPWRVVFSNLPSGYEPTTHGPSASSGANGTSTQFVTTAAGATDVNLGIVQPCDYCQSNPNLVTTKYVNGDPLLTSKPGGGSVFFPTKDFPAWIQFPYSSGATGAAVGNNSPPASGTTAYTALSNAGPIGTLWGLAYQRESKRIFGAAVVRRHAGLGPLGTGGIYMADLSGGTPTISSFVNLAAAPFNLDTGSFANPRGLDIETASPSHDDEAFGMIGKAGLGGLDVSTDGKYLWLVNLKTRTLHKLYVNNPAQPPTNAGDLTTPANQPWLSSNCPNGVERPWAVKMYGDKLYIGTVCTAETGGTAADLSAQVYAYDGTSFTKLLTIPLNYTKGAAYAPAEDPGQWYPWLDVYSDAAFNKSGSTVRTQPILSAIEFDANTGNMILGFTDRNGLQFGYQNYKPDGTTNTISGIAGGDILLACKSAGAWVAESNGQCPAGSNPGAAGAGDNQGPGNGEFFYDDRQGDASDPTNLTKGVHKDIHVGAVAALPGANDVAMTAMDPFRFATGGVAWLYTTNGANERRYEVYQQGTGLAKDRGSFAKSAGLGDLQLLCDPAPLEIGNRVWNDLDGDGVQDAGEPGLSGLTVSLQGPTNTVTVNTDTNGNYYFNNLKQYTAYTLTMSVPAGYSLTAANQAALSGASVSSNHAISDTIDSDAALVSGKATIYYSTGSAGQNNHGLDFGFTQPATGQVDIINTAPSFDLALKKTTAATTVKPGDDVQFTLEVLNQGLTTAYNVQVTDYITSAFTFDAANATNLANGWSLVNGQPTANIAGPIAGGASATVQIVLKVASTYQGTSLTNYAEISAADNDADSANPPPTDIDSTPDAIGANDGTAKDNVVTENHKVNTTDDEDDHDLAPINIGQTFDLALLKTTAATTVQPGQDVQFTIQVVNQGTLDAYNIQVTDYFTSGFTFDAANAANAGWILVNGQPTKSIAGPLAPGATQDIQITLKVASTFQGSQLTNNAEISAADNDTDSTNAAPVDVDSTPDTDNSNDGTVKDNVTSENWKADPVNNDQDDHDPASVHVNQTFDLALKKTTAATTVHQGDDVLFAITVYNQGTLDAYNIQISDYIPAGFTLNDANWTASNGVATLNTPIASLAAGQSVVVNITLQVDATFQGTSLTNYTEISSADNDTDGTNPAPVDVDSMPDNNPSNDGPAKNDVISEDGKANPGVNDEDDHDLALVDVGQTFDLALKKTTATKVAQLGDVVQFTVDVYNQGTLDAYNVQLTDYVPVGFTFDAANATNIANGWTLLNGKPTIVIAGPLAAGASTSVQIALQVDATFQGTSLTNYAEVSSADNDTDSTNPPPVDVDSAPDTDNSNDGPAKNDVISEDGKASPGVNDEDDHDIETIDVSQTFDLALKKTTAATAVHQGDDVLFAITVYNQGTVDATNIQVSDYIPAGFTLNDANWTASNGVATLNTPIASLAAGQSTVVNITLKVDATFQGTSLINDAEISAATSATPGLVDVDSTMDNNPSNDGPAKDDVISEDGKANPAINDEDDHDPASVNVGQTFDLALKKTAPAATVQQGDDVQFTVEVINQGTLSAYNIQLTDYVPASFTFDAANATNIANGWSLVNGKPTLTLAGPLAQGTSTNVQIVLQVGATFQGTSLTNYAEISSADNDTDSTNTPPTDVDSTPDAVDNNDGPPKDNIVNEDGKAAPSSNDEDDHDLEAVNVGQTFDLALTKTTTATTVHQGDDVLFTINVLNQGTLDAYNIQLTDYVPAGFTFDAANATNAANGWTLVNGLPSTTIAGPLAQGTATSVQIVLQVGATFQGASLTNYAEISSADNDTDATNTPPVDVDSTPDVIDNNDGTAKDNVVDEDGKADPINNDEDDHDLASVDVGQTFDLALRKATTLASAQQGMDVLFTIDVINQGTLDAYNIQLTDYVPSGFTFDAANAINAANGWALVNGLPSTTLAGPLAQGAATSVQIVLKVDATFQGRSLTNYVEISGADNDQNSTNPPPTDVDSAPDAINNNDGQPKDDVISEDAKADPINNDEDDHDLARLPIRLFDWGDLPDGNASNSADYHTFSANSGPSHEILPGLYLGSAVDGEIDGQPNSTATGDDLTNSDEDGVQLPAQFIAAQSALINVTVVNTTSQNATIYGFIDWNGDGDFSDLSESVSQSVSPSANSQNVQLTFTVPATATTTSQLGARFRLSTDGSLTADGPATNGEVEDYLIAVNAIYDWGDLPDGNATNSPSYATLNANGGPSHQIIPELYLGASEDNEADGQPDATATGDDATDDEDGITLPNLFVAGRSTVITATVFNNTGQNATLYGFIDWNGDGDFADVGETVSQMVNPSANSQPALLTFNIPITATTTQLLGARFRLSTDGSLIAAGPARDGEVEDYLIQVTAYDWGDLPDASSASGSPISPDYNTDSSGTPGASHVIVPGLSIGAAVDAETDGQPDGTAAGDDNAGVTPDDEAGVTFPANLYPGQSAIITVTVTNATGQNATLYGFIDWNGDGDFGDAGEAVTMLANSSGNVLLTFNIPASATITQSVGARFRLSTDGGLGSDGPASNGEVEDYLVKLTPPLSLGNLVWEDLNNNGLVDTGENGIPNVHVKLFLGDGVTEVNVGPDGILGTADDASGGMLTNATGHYLFAQLPPGDYIVEVTQPAGYTTSSGTNASSSGAYEPAPDEDTAPADDDDNGTLTISPTVRSAVVTLTVNGEPIGEDDQGDLPNPAVDSSSNLQVDFGFYQPLSLGNEVWIDANNDGLRQGLESYVPDGVKVNLYFDADNSGQIDGSETTPISSTTTVNGMYLFSHLWAGNYLIELDASNFQAGGLLAGYTSSVGQNGVTSGPFEGASTPDADNDASDGDDNGSVVGVLGSGGSIRSALITLSVGNEPSQEVPDNDGFTPDRNENLTVDFGLFRPLSLGNLVWNDLNNNGLYEPNGADNQPNTADDEVGLDNVVVELLDNLGQVVSTTNTINGGRYLFPNLTPGDYTVSVTPPPGYISSTGVNGQISGPYEAAPDPDNDVDNDDNGTDGTGANLGKVVSLGDTLALDSEPTGETPNNDTGAVDNNSNLTVDFGLFLPASLGNYVWLDVDQNGTQDNTPVGVPGVVVSLFTSSNTLVLTTTTNATGNYTFTNLMPGDYYVQFTPPLGYALSPQDTGGNTVTSDTTDSDADLANGKTIVTTLTPGENDLTWDAGLYYTASLGDRVWFDQNGDGVQDSNEPGVPNVMVTLLDGNGQPVPGINPVYTDQNGFYSFPNLAPGDYQVQFTLPNGYVFSPQDTGGNTPTSDVSDSDANPADGKTAVTNIAPDEHDPTWDAGIYLPVSLGNLVWEDQNNNGLVDAGEPGIPNVVVKLLAADGVTEIQVGPDGILGTADDATGGVQTDQNGNYRFSNLKPGDYCVVVVAPAGYASSTGANASLTGPYEPASDPDNDINNDDNGSLLSGTLPTGETLKAALVTLRSGDEPAAPTNDDGDSDTSSNLSVDFGLYQPLSLGNLVWYDADNSGTVNNGEQGIPSVTVQLYDATGTTLIATTQTNASGHYLFTDLTAGGYVVAVVKSTLPPTYVSSTGHNGFVSGPYEPAPDEDVTPADNDDNGSAVGPLVVTAAVTLTVGAEPANELDAGDIANPAGDVNSNLQVDFGFYVPLSLGNLVWEDKNNNGLVDSGEPGIDQVVVQLFGADGTTLIAQTTTDNTGHYRFDNLAPGDYSVVIQAPVGYISSTGQNGSASGPYEAAPDPDNDVNNDDNGTTISGAPQTGVTVKANPVTLTVNGEPAAPLNDDEDSDANTNLSVDFGLFRPLSLGNLVWEDTNNNGKVDQGESGIPNVTVKLYAADGQTLVATTNTNGTGHYLFTNLIPGDYLVEVVQSSLPSGLVSSSGKNGSASGPYEPAPDEDNAAQDNDDNGSTSGGRVVSAFVTLSPNSEPQQEPDAGDLADNAQDNNSNLQVDFGFYYPAALGDLIWLDLNKDGVQDVANPNSGEIGVSGVTVNLYDSQNVLVGSTTTGSDGRYLFENLSPGDYVVEFLLPPGYARSPQDASGDDATDSDANPNTGRTVPINLSTGETDLTWDAGIYFDASLGDRVWFDLNANGVQDTGEPGVPGIQVILFNSLNQQVGQPLLTDQNGNYAFSDLPPGDYYVQFVPPVGYLISPQDVGGNTPASNASDSDVNPGPEGTPGKTVVFHLNPNQHDPTWDLGIYQPVSLGNLVWQDSNNNGNVDAGEAGIPNVTVRLYQADGTAVGAPIKTDANGHYLFDNLKPGQYYVEIDAPSGYATSTGLPSSFSGPYEPAPGPNNDINNDDNGSLQTGNVIRSGLVLLMAGQEPIGDEDADANSNLTVDFGLYKSVIVGDYVWVDQNGNGLQDSGEVGVPNVKVTLYNALTDQPVLYNGTALVDRTDASGLYRFENLPPGNYYVVFDKTTLPAGYVVTQPNLGSDDAKDSDADSNGRTPATGFLPGGSQDLTLDLGIYQPVTVGDYVWIDSNDNGQQDNGEPGVTGVTVALVDGVTGLPISNNGSQLTTITDASGHYLFSNLPPGNYAVIFELATLPQGYVPVVANLGGDDAKDSDADSSGRTPPTGFLPGGSQNLTLDLGIQQPPNLVLIKQTASPIVPAGGVVTYTLTYVNQGPVFARNVLLTETVPAGTTFVASQSTPGWQCTNNGAAGAKCTFALGDLAKGQQGTAIFAIQLSNQVAVLTTIPNVAVVGTATAEVRYDDNQDRADVRVAAPNAVELEDFFGEIQSGGILLRWQTTVEFNTVGFHLFRSEDGQRSHAQLINSSLIASHGSQGGEYSFLDSNVQPDMIYTYWLVEVDADGNTLEYGPVRIGLFSFSIFLPTVQAIR